MVYVSVDVDLSVEDIADQLHSRESMILVENLLNNGHVPRGWAYVGSSQVPDLNDSAILLATIVELRKLGYTVEPGGA